jgi:hypothetical protein
MIDIFKLDREYQALRVQVILGKIKTVEFRAVPFDTEVKQSKPKGTARAPK